MPTTANLMKEGFRPVIGLDRKAATEYWHVAGIEGWTETNTNQKVFEFIPRFRGNPHPDPGLAGAICTNIQLADGPYIQGDGTYEAIVAVTFDSDRRWGSTFRESGVSFGKEIEGWGIETFVRGFQMTSGVGGGVNTYNWTKAKFPFKRTAIFRTFVCDATTITEDQKAEVFAYCGLLFKVYGWNYIYRSPSIEKLRTNQTLLRYNFESSSPVLALPANAFAADGITIAPTPSLDPLEEYVLNIDANPPKVGKKRVNAYQSTLGEPTRLPFWGARL